ncbi:MAG TPA: glycosyltransferase [Acidimicrobiales bacterium]|nr:glycosyltransferase [Acidimicrobiales bacterium]
MDSVSVVIVAYHRPDSLLRTLPSLQRGGIDTVVMNVDDDREVRTVAEHHGARVVPVLGNPGYAAAVNLGVAQTATANVVFANDDAALTGDVVLGLGRILAAREADVVVPAVHDDCGRVVGTVAPVLTLWRFALEWLLLPDKPLLAGHSFGVQKWRRPSRPEPIQAAAAVVVACRTDLLRSCPLPETYFMYWEESEWFHTLRRHGRKVSIDPELRIAHIGGRLDVRAQKDALLARNAVRCFRRTGGRTRALIGWPLVVLWRVRLLAVDSVRGLAGPRSSRRQRIGARTAGLRSAVMAVTEIR